MPQSGKLKTAKRILILIPLAMSLGGCATLLEKAAGFAGKKTGAAIARAQKPPKANVVADKSTGGPFCGKLQAYRFPELTASLTDSEIDALAPAHANTIRNIELDGRKNCPGWRK